MGRRRQEAAPMSTTRQNHIAAAEGGAMSGGIFNTAGGEPNWRQRAKRWQWHGEWEDAWGPAARSPQ
jgi:hypothetical protein